jgi:uncharacterized protein (DUF1778 family)
MAKRVDTTIKVDVEAARLAKIAASFQGKTMAEFVSELILKHAPEVIAAGAEDVRKGKKPGKGAPG